MKALRSLLAFATLSLWLSPAGAFCVAEFAYDYVMRESDPAPAQSLPCCVAAVGPFVAVDKDRPVGGRIPGVAANHFPARQPGATALRAPRPSPLPWRPYCERSSRLLR